MDKQRVVMWLRPGTRFRKWLVLAALAVMTASLGVGLVLADLYRVEPFPRFVYYLTLQFVPRFARGIILLLGGIGLAVFAWYQINRLLLELAVSGSGHVPSPLAARRQQLETGPRVVAIGGGTGLSTLLKGLKEVTANITAIVTVADDGGSSGRLRRDLGVLPPGDFRQCIEALADVEPLMNRLLNHRFQEGELSGHSFGNLFLTAMAEITGNFDRALEECSRVLAVRGRVIPSTLTDVTLCAELADGRVIRGESAIGHAGSPIRRVFLDPPTPSVYPEAVKAILEADTIVVGPGSLYTSVLPNLLIRSLARALQSSTARKIFVCNVATEDGETAGFRASDFTDTLRGYVGDITFDCVLVNNNLSVDGAADEVGAEAVELVRLDELALARDGQRFHEADVISESEPARHDPRKLARALMEVGLG